MITQIKFLTATSVLAFLTACTHGSVSNIPLEIQGIGTVYRYQGRANFAHQIEEADKMLFMHCLSINGGKPIVVDLQKRDLGALVLSNGTSSTTINGTISGNHNLANFSGNANTSSHGSASALRNINQEILYKCVKN